MYTVLEAKKISHCVVAWDDRNKYWELTKWGTRSTKTNSNRLVVFNIENTWSNPYSDLTHTGTRAYPNVGTKVYVDPSCHIRRDLVRRNFQITRDKDSADYILFPDVPPKYEWGDTQIVAYNPSESTFISVAITDDIVNDNMWDMLLLTLKTNYGSDITLYYKDRKTIFTYWFLPYCEIYKDILCETNRTKRCKFINEYKIPYNETQLAPEAMMLWRSINEGGMLASEIKQTNWRKYPFTLSVFLCLEVNKYVVMHHCMNDIRYALPINFTAYYNQTGNYGFQDFDSRYIDPEDWNLMQEYIMMRMGVDKNGGFTSTGHQDITFPVEYLTLIRNRLAVAPVYLQGGDLGRNLITTTNM